MKELYLTNKIKEFHKGDFEQSLTSDVDFWKIEDSLVNYLIKINSNSAIQTLYSKNWNGDIFTKSYLTFCYKVELEQRLFKEFIPMILSRFNEFNKCSCIYIFNYPRDNENYNPERKLGFSCTDNKDHFRINHIKLEFKSRDKNKHIEFWENVADGLSKIYYIKNC